MELREIIKEAAIVDENATFREALKAMVDRQTNSLLVVNSDGVLVGEVGVSDLMDAIMPEYLDGDTIAADFATEEMFEEAVRNAADKEVCDFMMVETDPIRVDDGLMAVAATAIAQQRARIPVVDDEGRPVGIISRRGLKAMLAAFLNISDQS